MDFERQKANAGVLCDFAIPESKEAKSRAFRQVSVGRGKGRREKGGAERALYFAFRAIGWPGPFWYPQ